jgi:hypothetical protein
LAFKARGNEKDDRAKTRNVSDPINPIARTINKLKGKVTMLFITHQIPRGLAVDEVIELGTNTNRQMEVVVEEK